MEPIDIVVTWVDGNDPEWQRKKAEYTGVQVKEGNTDARYRDWGTLKYWFRGIEKYAPWVRYVHFVTDNQKPDWLNLNHPKLKWVKHTDYIPEQYLPTFNSHVIEWNLHRIEGLSEHFIYFNDDVFMIKDTQPSDFFIDGAPCVLPVISPLYPDSFVAQLVFNNVYMLNRNFSFKNCVRKNPQKWLKNQSVLNIVKLVLFGRHDSFPGLGNAHIHQCFKKSTMQILWDCEYDLLNATCLNKVRGKEDLTPWCITDWQILSGDFTPKKLLGRRVDSQTEGPGGAVDYLLKRKGKIVCINDNENELDYVRHMQLLIDAFEKVLPEKSAFEL